MNDIQNRQWPESGMDSADIEGLYRILFEEAADGMFLTDPFERCIAINRWAEALIGYSNQEMQGVAVTTLIPPEDLAVQPIRMDALRQGKTIVTERRLRRKDGSLLTAEITTRMLPAGHMLGIFRDITDRKQAEEALRRSEKRYRDLHRNIHDGLAAVNQEGVIIEFNPAFQNMLGYTRQEIEGLTYEDITPAKWHDLEKKILEEQVMSRGFSDLYEKEYIRKDGTVFPVELRTYLIQDETLTHKGFWAIVRDITDRKQSEDAIRREMMFSENIINALPGVFYMYNDKPRLVRWNKKLEQMTGYPAEELYGMDVLDFFSKSHHSAIIDGVGKAFAEGEAFAEAPLLTKGGRSIPYFWTGRVVVLDGQRYMIGLGLDITGFKKAEEEKAALQVQLLQAQKMESVGRLAGGVAHDFNNMLAAIIGHAELARLRLGTSGEIEADLKLIEDAAQRSADLVRQLLAFASKQAATPRAMDLNVGVAGMLKMLRRLIGENIDLEWRPGAELWRVRMDPSQVDQILVNLCVNARDAIPGVGRITIETGNAALGAADCALYPEAREGDYVMLSVSDNGCGMSREVMDHLFEPFFTTKAVGKGTGLGLSTVYGIVKQNEGFVSIDSEPGHGARLKVYLPRFLGNIGEALTGNTVAMPEARGETVLLVEDEQMILNVGKVMLEKLGYAVLTAGTPAQALRRAETPDTRIDLLITDVIMPEMNGRELVEQVLTVRPGIKSLFISGYTADVIARRGLMDDGVHFLQKPFSMQDLAVKVRQALGRR